MHRALRVTVAAGTGFYVCRYLLDFPTTALYAIFAAIAVGALSEVIGTPAQRTRGYGAVLVAGLVLVGAGTMLAVNTAAATAGMLVFGFAIAYAGVTGPRIASVANGLQLFYVLPCFPPFAPEQLGERLAGVAVGVALLALADRLLWPVPGPADLAPTAATAARRIGEYAAALAAALRSTRTSDPDTLAAARRAAVEAADGLRLSRLDVARRPLGYGMRDRSMLVTCAALRLQAARLAGLADLLARPGHHRAHPATAELVDAAGDAVTQVGAALGGQAGPPRLDRLDAALRHYVEHRAEMLTGPAPGPDLRAGLSAAAIAEMARVAALAVHGVVAAGAAPVADPPPELWFVRLRPAALLWARLRNNLTPRSVYLQNAVRIAVGLAVARVVAGTLDLQHGFWVLLATLSLMRTSAVASRAVLLRAFLGTVAGAVVAAGVLLLVGPRTDVYAWLLPALMVLAFAAGPLFGVAAGQAGFTIVVAVLFAQVNPPTWQLAAVRLVDVVIGGLVGAVIGAAIWPRGGGGEIRRIAADSLRAGADEVVTRVGQLSGGAPAPDPRRLSRLAAMFDHTYIQYRTEPTRPGRQTDWLTVLAIVHRLAGYSETLRERHPDNGPLPWPEAGQLLRATAEAVAAALCAVADAVAAGTPVPAGTAATCRERFAVQTPTQLADDPGQGLRLLDAWGWLDTLVTDIGRLEAALADPGGEPAQATQLRSAVKPTDIDGS